MNLSKLFETQKELDERIVKEKGLHGQDLLDEKILALQVELGELANEWRGFKFWSEDQEPKKEDDNWYVAEDSIRKYEDTHHRYYTAEVYKKRGRNPLLEEYVDCLHFILSIGNDCQFDGDFYYTSHKDSVLEQFNYLFNKIGDFYLYRTTGNYTSVFNYFLALGDFLGFTWEQIEQAYYEKNKINHERQESGY